MPKMTKRKTRKRELSSNYLSGMGRMSYTHRPALNSSLEEGVEQPGPSGAS